MSHHAIARAPDGGFSRLNLKGNSVGEGATRFPRGMGRSTDGVVITRAVELRRGRSLLCQAVPFKGSKRYKGAFVWAGVVAASTACTAVGVAMGRTSHLRGCLS